MFLRSAVPYQVHNNLKFCQSDELWSAAVIKCHRRQGHRSWEWGVLTPWKHIGRVRVCFDPLNATFVHSKLLLGNSASFASSRMKDLSKMDGKTNFSRGLRAARNRDCWVFGNHWRRCNLKQFDGLTWLTLTPLIFYNKSMPLISDMSYCGFGRAVVVQISSSVICCNVIDTLCLEMVWHISVILADWWINSY